LNGGQFADVTPADWDLIRPYLEENEKLFGISVERLLMVDGLTRTPGDIYRKIRPQRVAAFEREDSGLTEWEGHPREEQLLLAARRRRSSRADGQTGTALPEFGGEEEDYVPPIWRV
ncbi:MAG: hypothetical protein JW753_09180, partial [Dehalococcoidia bacterium]|nr:hypothetical protein [Dehalococcoidia bacterium]